MGRHFLVTIVEVGETTLRVTFPAKDHPIAGMPVDLEFHDVRGFYCYPTEVLENPAGTGGGRVLRKPLEPKRNEHRRACRVLTDLTVQVRDQTCVRKYDAALQNLSADGALIQTDAPFDFGSTIEMTLSLPGEPSHTVLCQVVYSIEVPDKQKPGFQLHGVHFPDPDPESQQAITRFVWSRLREMYSAG
jgi:Tfp pilus assembly protein PilZ